MAAPSESQFFQDALSITAYCGYMQELKILPFISLAFYRDDEFLLASKHVRYGYYSRSRLMSLSRKGDETRVSLLLRAKTDVHALDRYKGSALHWAVEAGKVSIVTLLLKNGADVNAVDERYRDTPFLIAVKRGHDEVCLRLLEHGADAYRLDEYNCNALRIASTHGNEKMCRVLLHGNLFDVNAIDTKDGRTALTRAAEYNTISTIRCLIEHGADVNLGDTKGATPLHWVVGASKNSELLYLLKNTGANVNCQNNDGATPLLFAAEQGNASICLLLLKYGADANIKNKYGTTPLMRASSYGMKAVVSEMISKGNANVNAIDNNGNSALLWSCWKGQENVGLYLVDCGTDIHVKNISGNTALSWATKKGLDALRKQLLKKGARVTKG